MGKNNLNDTNKKSLKALVFILKLLTLALIVYLLFLPFYSEIIYKLKFSSTKNIESAQSIIQVSKLTDETLRKLPQSEDALEKDRLIITKIGVNAPIIQSDNADYGLSLGTWLVPDGSTPDKGGNTVLTGHRFKYLPPNNLTFYLFDKLTEGDIISVIFKQKKYFYQVKEIKIVDKDDATVYDQTASSTLTMYTCTPIYSTSHRLVIISELLTE